LCCDCNSGIEFLDLGVVFGYFDVVYSVKKCEGKGLMGTLSVKSLLALFFCIGFLFAQNDDSANPFGGDPFGGLSVDSVQSLQMETPKIEHGAQSSPVESNNTTNTKNSPQQNQENQNPAEIVPLQTDRNQTTNVFNQLASSDNLDGPVQNAIIEGVQITTDKGETPDEKIVSGYFIFRDKPSHYFYEVKLREKKIVFEFNDTKTGSSPVPSTAESPIKGFTIVSDRIDINSDVKGLKPEYHNLIRVVFDMEGIPDIRVNDEYSIITFSFKWSTNPQLVSKYTVKDKTPKIILWSTVGVGAVGLGTLAAVLISKPEPSKPLGPLDIDDLPGDRGK
jgi:hypothetical protein